MPVRGVLQDGEPGLDLGERNDLHALGRRGVDRHPNRTEAVIEQDLGEHAAGRVPDDDRRTIQFPDQVLEHLDDLRHLELLDRRGVSAERLDSTSTPGTPV